MIIVSRENGRERGLRELQLSERPEILVGTLLNQTFFVRATLRHDHLL